MTNEDKDFVDENDNKVDDREEATIGMSEIDGFDFERAVMLMSVMEKVANVAPKAASISGLAAAALNEMNEEAKDIAKHRAEEFAKLEAQRAEALAAQQREREEEERAQAKRNAEAADERAREPTPPQPRPAPHTQSQAPAPSKTNQVASDNARRL